MGYWKAEDFRKFAYPASEYCLGGLLPDQEYHAWVLLARITELLFNTGRVSWTENDSNLLYQLIARHNILTEEVQGVKSCVVTLHNLLHIPEDINEFSTVDNYWCYTFERAVKKYVLKPSNGKNLELTFARSECRREFLRFYNGSCNAQRVSRKLYNGYLVSFHYNFVL